MTLFKKPTYTRNPEGKPRKVGFEFELAGIEPQACAELVADLFDGTIQAKHSLEIEIAGTPMGTFKVELDAKMLKDIAKKLEKEQPEAKNKLLDTNSISTYISKWVGELAGQVVPLEIVTPPLICEQFQQLETLRKELCKKKATGTKAAFTNAFGMHINPEITSKKVEHIHDIMRAFLVLYPWLKEVMEIDLSRQLLTYIDPFPNEYVTLVLAENYAPSLDGFIDDYLEHNPTRNRVLDMLPLFAYLKPDSLDGLKEEDRKLVKARPTFHYRLPNCEIDNPDWSIARDWNYWVEIEKLAEDKQKLANMASAYLTFLDKPFHAFSNNWVEQITSEFGYETQ